MTPLRNVVFDVGGVLINWDPRHLYRKLIPDQDEMETFLGEICTPAWNEQLDAGRPFEEACDELSEEHPQYANLIHAWKRQDEMVVGEVQGTAALVNQLRQQGIRLLVLTNMPSDVFARRQKQNRVFDRFDAAVVSGAEGLVKPDPRIYEILSSRHAVEPTETLFIDDNLTNVRAAVDAGYYGHHFCGAQGLAQTLSHHGLTPE